MPDPKDVARQWVGLVLPPPGLKAVIYLDHATADAPRPPALPYAGIMINSDEPQGWQTPVVWTEDTEGWPATKPPGEKFPQHAEWVLEGQLLVMLYGPGSIAMARTLRISLATPAVIEFLAAEEVSITNGVTATNDSEILDTTREERVSIQFDIAWIERVTSQIDVIEKVTPVLTTT